MNTTHQTMNIDDCIDLKTGTVNFTKKMTTIFDRVKEAVSEPWLLDDQEIQTLFAGFYDEIDTLIDQKNSNIEELQRLKDAYIIPILTETDAFAHYKQRAYENREKEFDEMKQEEQDEMDYACENDMDPIYWCERCKVGVCDIHQDRVSEFDIPTRDI